MNSCRTPAWFIARVIATGLGSGLAPKAPGTFGTLVGLGVWAYIKTFHPTALASSPWFLAVVAFTVGILASHICIVAETTSSTTSTRTHTDPQYIVIDEWVGLFITLEALPKISAQHLLWGFILFRIFDILKPGPIRLLERLPGALGVMMDDVGAGVLGFLVITAYYHFFPSLL